MRALLALMLAIFSAHAFAAGGCRLYQITYGSQKTSWGKMETICAEAAGFIGGGFAVYSASAQNNCILRRPKQPSGFDEIVFQPTGSRDTTAEECDDAGFCRAGRLATFMAQTGWGLTNGPGNLSAIKELSDAEFSRALSMCSGGCVYRYLKDHPANGGAENDPRNYWEPNLPVGTWTPFYSRFGYAGSGQSCTQGGGSYAQDFKPTPGAVPPDNPAGGEPTNPMSCSHSGGYWGSVNGVDRCVQKAPTPDASGAPGPTTGTQSGNKDPANRPPNAVNNDNGNAGTTDGGSTSGSGGSSGGSRPGGGTGPGSGPGKGPSGAASGPSGAGSAPSGTASSPVNVTIKCQDLGTCPDSNAGGGLPGRPTLWEPKYPDGVGGVWQTRVGELKQAPVYQLASSMLPKINGGTPPTWDLNFDFPGIGNFGTFTLGPESAIWGICRSIVIVSALIFAFRIVFGGA